MGIRSCLLAVTCSMATAIAALAEPLPCDTTRTLVETDDQDLHERVCNVVMTALPVLENCHLRQNLPVLIRFNDALSTSGHDCLGLYHDGKGQIDLLTPEAFHSSHIKSDYCKEIPENVHFDSIIVHEMTHALLDQVPGAKDYDLVDQEYIAYAMQFEIIHKSVRDRFLSSIGLSAPIEPEWINEFILSVSPSVFAASSWLHFSSSERGCEFVGKIIRGEETLWQQAIY